MRIYGAAIHSGEGNGIEKGFFSLSDKQQTIFKNWLWEIKFIIINGFSMVSGKLV